MKSARLRYFNAASADPAAEIDDDHNPKTHIIPLDDPMSQCLEQTIRRRAQPYVTLFMWKIALAHVLALQHLLDNGDAVNLGTVD